MSILKHPILQALAKMVEQSRAPFRWIDLYAAQYAADSFKNDQAMGALPAARLALAPGEMSDLFDDPAPALILNEDDVVVLVLLCSQQVSQGHICLDLNRLPPTLMSSVKACGYHCGFECAEEWVQALNACNQEALLHSVPCSEQRFLQNEDSHYALPSDNASEQTPALLVLCGQQLFLARYWHLHQQFEQWIGSRNKYLKPLSKDCEEPLALALKKVFLIDNTHKDQELNWQAVAAAHTLMHPFSLITGGPGTGKTTTAASFLYLLAYKHHLNESASSANKARAIRVRLLAPTGKAAVKLADSIRRHLQHLEARLSTECNVSYNLSDVLPETGETVHRFLYELGGLRDSVYYSSRFNSDELLHKRAGKTNTSRMGPLDVVVVDESSMMDLALMVELISLIPDHTQLILMGDHHQLPAVEPGQVFAECVRRFTRQAYRADELRMLSKLTGYSTESLENAAEDKLLSSSTGFKPLCELKKTYRFAGDLKVAAEQIKTGNSAGFIQSFGDHHDRQDKTSDVIWHDLGKDAENAWQVMLQGYADYFKCVSRGAPLAELASEFERYQLLCSTLEGPLGVHVLNSRIEQKYQSACLANGPLVGTLYHGKPILVTRNHPRLGIYNGDVGYVIKTHDTAHLNVYFPLSDEQTIIVPPARIKQWQSAYAMTVHKSQGSEYHQVGVVLADYAKELLSRSLLYTALTRSKQACQIWASEMALKKTFETV